jgi:4'-phosphopantetheinyl transferase
MPHLTYLPLPDIGEIHIHCSFPAMSETTDILSIDETSRADRLMDHARREQFIACRTKLRTILGSYLRQPPENLLFTAGEYGKPRLMGTSQLHFNLSHSGGLFILALARNQEVGVDCEMVRQDIPIHDLARLAFSTLEQKELGEMPAEDQRRAFYHCWTRKEAYLKGCGRGFSFPSSSFNIGVNLTKALTIPCNDTNELWYLHDLTVPNDFCAALAVTIPSPRIRYFGIQ